MNLKKFSTIIFFLLCIQNTYAENTILRICMKDNLLLSQIKKDIQFIISPEDTYQIAKNCLEIKTIQLRETLYKKFFKQKYPRLQIHSTADKFDRAECKLEFIKKNRTQVKTQQAWLLPKYKNINHRQQQGKESIIKQLYTLDESPASISIANHKIEVFCQVRKTGYQIQLSTDSLDLSLVSKFFLKKGETKHIGHSSKKTSKDNHQLSLGGVKWERNERAQNFTLFIRTKE